MLQAAVAIANNDGAAGARDAEQRRAVRDGRRTVAAVSARPGLRIAAAITRRRRAQFRSVDRAPGQSADQRRAHARPPAAGARARATPATSAQARQAYAEFADVMRNAEPAPSAARRVARAKPPLCPRRRPRTMTTADRRPPRLDAVRPAVVAVARRSACCSRRSRRAGSPAACEYFTLRLRRTDRRAAVLARSPASSARCRARSSANGSSRTRLYDWDAAHDERYISEVLLKPPSWLGRNTDAAADRRRGPRAVRGARRGIRVRRLVRRPGRRDAAADRRLHQRLPAAPGLARARQAPEGAAARTSSSSWAAPTARRRWASRRCASSRSSTRSCRARRIRSSRSWRCAWSRGEPVSGIPGVITQASVAGPAGLGPAPTAPAVTDLDALPYPDYTDFFAQFERSQFGKNWQPSVFVETSRGCWWGERMHCTFCGLNGATMAFRSKSAPRALERADAPGDVVSRAATSRWSTTSST